MKAEELLEIVSKEIVSPVYLVGGCVRDIIRGVEPNDFDFATPHTVDVVEEAIKASGRRAYQIGNSKRHGTMACKIDGQEVQITTFRTETYNEGSRQPITVPTEDLATDLSRRDFTMNAIALGTDGLIDPYDGAGAIKEKHIIAVGDACERFQEDPLRILRAYRFASTLSFNFVGDLTNAIFSKRGHLLTVSKERWVSELDKLLMGDDVEKAIRMMNYAGIFEIILPGISPVFLDTNISISTRNINERWLIIMQYLTGIDGTTLTLDRHKSIMKRDIVRMYCGHLKFSKERTQYLLDNI